MKWSVYIMRFPNKKKYVGVTRLLPFHIRIKQHIQSAMSGSNLTLSCAIRKYGALSIKFGVVAKCNSEKEAKHLEVEYIRELDTLRPHGYNSTVGGNGVIDPSGMSECKRVSSCKKTMATSAYKEKQRQIQKQVWNEDKCLQRSEETK